MINFCLLLFFVIHSIKTNYDKYKTALRKYRNDPAAEMIGKIPDQKDSKGNFRT